MGSANITLHAVETRLTLLDQLWTKFERQHELVRAHYKESYDQSEYSTSQFADSAEITYVQQRSLLNDYAARFKAEQSKPVPPSESGNDLSTKSALPRLKIRSFSGAFEDWPSFRDIFLSIVGNNPSISNVEKFHHLKHCLEGSAETLIRPLAVTGDNYLRAWTLLCKHFENKRELSRSNFCTFTAVQKMKSDSAGELSRVYNAALSAVNGQDSIGRPIDSHGFDLFNHLVIELFDPKTRLEWESHISDSTDLPNHDTLMDFIAKRTLTLKAARSKPAKISEDSPRVAKTHVAKRSTDTYSCVLCKNRHNVMMCDQFKAKSASDRKSVAETYRLCYNCLGSHPIAKCQSTKTCITCKARHHSLLHEAFVTPTPTAVSTLTAVRQDEDCKAIMLATTRVTIADRYGHPHPVRALIDQGSEVTLISEALVQRLHLPRSRASISIFGIGGSHSGFCRGKVSLNLTSNITGAQVAAVAFILPRLSLYQGATSKDKPTWPHIKDLQLADPQFTATDPIEVLLGAEIYAIILQEGLRKGDPRTPVAQSTLFGWVLSGGCGDAQPVTPLRSFQVTADHELTALVQRFWEQEREPSAPVAATPDEQRCEDIFAQTHKRTATGRYVVRLPFASPPTRLCDIRQPAERMMTAMERRCERDAHFGQLYRAFLKEYEELNHMELVPRSSESHVRCYLPHHGILRETCASTKLRVVFNGSQKSRAGESLNSQLLIGANLLPSLADVLTRWRWHRYVFVTDMEKMYRQILVSPEDRDCQRILWRHSVTDPVREFRLNTVTYGLSCAPFLAIRTLRQLADDEEARFPRGSAVLRRDCYVDDIVTGAHTKTEIVAVQRELRQLCMAGGFPLKKWAANHPEILVGIPVDHCLVTNFCSWEQESHATLGLQWHPTDDVFTFTIRSRTDKEFTKRSVLAETARLFDPLGWLTPVIIRAKILIQSAWLQRVEWDAPLPRADACHWRRFLEELPKLNQLRITRWLGTGAEDSKLELHGFADASERGYAAVAYLRVTRADDIAVFILAAKSKVAPIKPVSLPRLELCAAALLTHLIVHIRTVLSLFTAPVTLWSDSRVTLQWIQGHASRWKTFVANRVSLIQELLPEAHWRHVPGKDNPALRLPGIAPSVIVNHTLWWSGPSWLIKDTSAWPGEQSENPLGELLEQRVNVRTATSRAIAEPEFLLRFSSLHRLLRVTAWCLRWPRRKRTPPPKGIPGSILTPEELDEVLYRWIQAVQGLHYNLEVAAVKARRLMSSRSQLRALDPFIDDHGVLRVGGRLKHAILSPDERHPMVVPPQSHLTRLLVESCHRRTLHGGVQLTLSLARLRFWIPRGRSVVKYWLHRCVPCTRWKGITPQPPMGNLPRGRVTPARPFIKTGIDYAGPIYIRTSRGRGHKATKAFTAIFVCLCSKAIHLEVSDYMTDAFLAALHRFTSRRGLCTDIYSDCGTNFVGADRQLRELLRACSVTGRRIAHVAVKEGIRWHFNPPSAPHFGGLWEAAVKSTKYHLRRVIGDTTLTFEEMSTLLAQVEACLNSRPLQALSEDLSALTPGHLLIGAPLLAIPEPSLTEKPENSLSRWQHLQRMRDHFWERWSREYLHSLTSRPKWFRATAAPHLGSLCLIASEISPPSRWPLARIVRLHPGEDGVSRVATVRTASSELVRPLVKLVLLPGVTAPTTPSEDL